MYAFIFGGGPACAARPRLCAACAACAARCQARDALPPSHTHTLASPRPWQGYNYGEVRRWTLPRRLKGAGQLSDSVLDCDLIVMPVHQASAPWVWVGGLARARGCAWHLRRRHGPVTGPAQGRGAGRRDGAGQSRCAGWYPTEAMLAGLMRENCHQAEPSWSPHDLQHRKIPSTPPQV